MTINMSSIEEVTNQLMKSVKELADWEYPLSEVLGKYYALLEQPIEINFGEAALVVQNTTDVYIRRVDSLSRDVCNLSESFLQREAEEEKAKSRNKEKRSRKTLINFDNFELLDLKKEVGKNINQKSTSQKPVKLLNRRFPQLETGSTQLLTPIEVFDIHEEVIGKKYDFRCNQQLTVNGLLVDECMPSDFHETNRLSNQVNSTPIHETEEPIFASPNCSRVENMISQEDTGYFSLNDNVRSEMDKSFESNEGLLEAAQETNDLQRSSESHLEMDCSEEPSHFDDSIDHDDLLDSIEEPENSEVQNTTNTIEHSNTKDLENQTETVPNDDNQSNQDDCQVVEQETDNIPISIRSSFDGSETPDRIENTASTVKDVNNSKDSENQMVTAANCDNQSNLNECQEANRETSELTRNSVNDLSSSENSNNEQSNSGDCQDVDQEISPSINTLKELESSKKVTSDSRATKSTKNNQGLEETESRSENCKESDSGCRSSESDFEIPRRRSKRAKNMVCVVNDMDKNVWKPIPFDQGIPEKHQKSRAKFKLPCHISLLKAKSRKRKLSTEKSKKGESLPKFLTNETESPLKKLNMYSPSRPFMPLKTEELNDFQKSFEDCFKNRQCYDVFHYEAATTITMDLLGFFPSFTKKDPLLSPPQIKTLVQTPEHVSASCSDLGFSPRPASPELIIFDTNSSPGSPAMSDIFDVEEQFHSTPNFQRMIESRMKEIHEEFDVRTDLEQNVARWHQMIQPKLQEVEKRPPFHIQEYRDRILDKLKGTTGRRMAFENLIVDETPAEAARLFSAMLHLANTENVDIQTSEKKTDIELIFLKSIDAEHEIMCETPKTSKWKNTKKFKRIS